MTRIFDIAMKDLLQLGRDFKTFMFLLLMPILFTLLFGYAFGGFGGGVSDSRLPVGFLNEDTSWLSQELHDLLAKSEVIRLEEGRAHSAADLEKLVADEELAAAIVIPAGFGKATLSGKPALPLTLIADTATPAGQTVESEALANASRLDSAVHTAIVIEETAGGREQFDYLFEQALSAWEEPPIAVVETTSSAIKQTDDRNMSLAHTSPGMMLQFAIAGLLTAAQIIVSERKTRSLQRLLTTAARRIHILLGHYLAIFILIFTQFMLLIAFGQLILKVDYLRLPAATLLVAFSAALWVAAMGLFIGVLAKSDEQAVIFSLIPMFILSGLGGAWVPLEVTGPVFQTVGHLSPVAWAMDGFKNITVRGFGLESVLLPAGALAGYAVLFFALAVFILSRSEEKNN